MRKNKKNVSKPKNAAIFFFLENLGTEQEQGQACPEEDKDTECNQSRLNALRRITHQKQDRETKHDGNQRLQDQIVGSRRFKFRVDFAQQNHAVACRTRQHAEHGKKPSYL